MLKILLTFAVLNLVMAPVSMAQSSCDQVVRSNNSALIKLESKSISEKIIQTKNQNSEFLAALKTELDSAQTASVELVLAELLTDKIVKARHGTSPALDLIVNTYLARKDKNTKKVSNEGFVVSDVHTPNSLISLALFSYNPKLAMDLLNSGYPANGTLKFYDLVKFGFKQDHIRFPFSDLDSFSRVSNLIVASMLGYNEVVGKLIDQGAQTLYIMTSHRADWSMIYTTYRSEIKLLLEYGKFDEAAFLFKKFPGSHLPIEFKSEGETYQGADAWYPDYNSRRYESVIDWVQGIQTIDRVLVKGRTQRGHAYPTYRSNWSGNSQYPAPALSFNEIISRISDPKMAVGLLMEARSELKNPASENYIKAVLDYMKTNLTNDEYLNLKLNYKHVFSEISFE